MSRESRGALITYGLIGAQEVVGVALGSLRLTERRTSFGEGNRVHEVLSLVGGGEVWQILLEWMCVMCQVQMVSGGSETW